MFPFEICEIFKNTYFQQHLWMTASVETPLKTCNSFMAFVCVCVCVCVLFFLDSDLTIIGACSNLKSSRHKVFCKKGVLRNFAKFTGKHLCQSLRPATLLKKRLWHRCFPANFAKFLRTPFFTEHLCWLLLKPGTSANCQTFAEIKRVVIISLKVFTKAPIYFKLLCW